MSPWEGLLYGFSVALAPANLLAALAGAVLGTFVGVLPGLGPVGAMALLMTATLSLKPDTALILLAGLYYGSMYGGSTTSILLRVPGEAASVVTSIDGYEMAKQGRAGAALAVAAVGSFLAGTIGIIGLMLFTPLLASVALSFGAPEYFTLTLLGLVALSQVTSGSIWKSLVVLGLGLGLATVGMDPVSGSPRFAFGIIQLTQGIELVPVVMGLYGLAEVLEVAERGGGLPRIPRLGLRELFPSRAEWARALPAILRGTGVGFLIGLIPGPATVLATFVSYNVERRSSTRPHDFGHGAIEGVAGPEAANNAASSSAFVPLLGVGIPFAPVTALLLAALMMQGVRPGPLLIEEHPHVFWGVVASMYVGNVALLVLNLPLVGMWASLLRIPQSILLVFIVIFTLVGAYSINNSLFDLLVLVAMGIVGYLLRKLQFDIAPMILAIVLGPMLEGYFRRSLFLSRGDPLIFLQRPISAVLAVAVIAILIGPSIWRAVRRGR